MPTDSWNLILNSVSLAVVALLPIIGRWVALRLRSTSKAVESISEDLKHCSELLVQLRDLNALVRDVPDRKK